MESLSYEEFKKRYGTVGLAQANKPPEPNWAQRVGEQFKQGVSYAKEGFKGLKPYGALDPRPNSMFKQTEAIGKIGAGIIQAGFSPVTATLQPAVEPTLGRGLNAVANKIAENPSAQRFADSKAGQAVERGAETVRNYADIAGVVVGPKVAGRGIVSGANRLKKGAQETTGMLSQDVSKVRKIIEPTPPTPGQAMGQVLQGQTKDIPTGFKALKNLDLKDVNTYSDFSNRIGEGIVTLAKQVDETLDLDQTLFKRKDLLAEAKTAAGKVIKTDYITRGLNQLKELYTSIGDDVAAADLSALMQKVKKEGLTRRQVNDLARVYGEEFSSKAFSKLGDPLTSINAQLFETTRKGLKEIARKGMAGTKAEALDKSISSLYRVQTLIKKNAEAVNKLNQKIQERGIVEKIGYQASKALDLLSGGSLRGIVGGLLPRGAGYKVMNALDLEKVLNRNLQIIEKALKDDEALNGVLKKLNESGGSKAKDFLDGMMDSNVGLATKNTIDDPLISEARKYKSAEEFVKDFTAKSGRPLKGSTPTLKMAENRGQTFEELLAKSPAMLKGRTGFDRPPKTVKVYRGVTDERMDIGIGDYVTTDKAYARKYGKIVKEAEIPASELRYMWGSAKGNHLGEFPEYIFYKTKSQLTDIWNKANKNTANKAGRLAGVGAVAGATYYGSQ